MRSAALFGNERVGIVSAVQRILFVDDEPSILDGLRRMLRPMRSDWLMEFADSGQNALKILEGGEIDVVVSDMRMPDMDGAQLLQVVRERWPSVARIILSGHADRSAAVRSVGVAHQFLAKPCDGSELRSVVQRTCALRATLISPEVLSALTEIGELPAIPALYAALNRELGKPEPSLPALSKLIGQDPGMSAKILQLVNSAFFGLRRRVKSIDEAVTNLGTDVVRSLALSSTAFTTFTNPSTVVSAERLWKHSMRVAEVAAHISAVHGNDRAGKANSFQAGILHELGKLIILFKRPSAFDAFEVQHGAIGAYLLGLWGLEDPVVEAVAFHHLPSLAPAAGLSALVAVHLANHLVHASVGEGDHSPLDPKLIERPDIKPHLEHWMTTGAMVLREENKK